MDILATQQKFESLSVKDLLRARDLYHYHLLNKANVVGTAIGRYLIRKSDPWPKSVDGNAQPAKKGKRAAKSREERRFDNSEVRNYSWPCVLVLVKDWVAESGFTGGQGRLRPDQVVPKTLYLPDGLMVPVCVVKVTPGDADATPGMPQWHWPRSLIGGGFPLEVDVQGRKRVASIGCLVSDGHTTYALTNRHVCGETGTPVFSILRGQREQVGTASDLQLTRMPFSEVYPDFVGARTYLNLDIGLVRVDDVGDWTSQIYGLGPIGEMADLNELNITLRMIDAEVVGQGAASGALRGKIKALFYRYKSVGGYDYVSDFLIAPEGDEAPQTRQGDSGTIWHLVPPPDPKLAAPPPRPLAVEWGGQTFAGAEGSVSLNFALATSLSNVCKLLDVELVRTQNLGARPYWGQMGHYSIGAYACEALAQGKLRRLMTANLDRISFARGDLTPNAIKDALKLARDNDDFVPLADVPDIVWKNLPSRITGGRDVPAGRGRTTGPEHPTHYADIDQPNDAGQTLLKLCLADRQNVNVGFWQSFYDGQGHTQSRNRGLLPFRVWQIFVAMVKAVQQGNMIDFVCAAGILSHYTGDACQPLHGSFLADGYADQKVTVTRTRRDGSGTYEEESHAGAGVHSAYETAMVDRYSEELIIGLTAEIGARRTDRNIGRIASGHDAAVETVKLMDRAARRIPPGDLVDTYIEAGGTKRVAVYDALWDAYGKKTIATMADGARVLARLWEGAWTAGGGNQIAATKIKAISEQALARRYRKPDFLPSLDLDHIAPKL